MFFKRMDSPRPAPLGEKKYVLVPGYVTSQVDGDHHFVSHYALAHLYNVPLRECYVETRHSYVDPMWERKTAGLKRLYPRGDGAYPCFRRPEPWPRLLLSF